jgi:hypothetical protein
LFQELPCRIQRYFAEISQKELAGYVNWRCDSGCNDTATMLQMWENLDSGVQSRWIPEDIKATLKKQDEWKLLVYGGFPPCGKKQPAYMPGREGFETTDVAVNNTDRFIGIL